MYGEKCFGSSGCTVHSSVEVCVFSPYNTFNLIGNSLDFIFNVVMRIRLV